MSYLSLFETGELHRRVEKLKERMDPCRLCPRECKAKRFDEEIGQCGAGQYVDISGYAPHFGEEPPLVGRKGSGTIFFAFCSLRCVFCQNYKTSRGHIKYQVTEELAHIMLRLQDMGCVNINLVTPSHYVPQIIEALTTACEQGLHVPLVYNCSGYEQLDTLCLLDGIVDIYLPDIKYANAELARMYSGITDYPDKAKTALKEMQRQVGDLQLNDQGIAVRGMIIRHLVMPGGVAGTADLMQFIAREVSPRACINIMSQYRPAYLAHRYPEINRRITSREYKEGRAAARAASPYFILL